MARVMRGEIEMRLVVWRRRVQLAGHAKQRMQSALEAEKAVQGAGVRLLRQVMVRMVKGDVGMRLEAWRAMVVTEGYAKRGAARDGLKALLKAQGQEAGVRMMRHVMVRMAKGEVGMRLEVWRTKAKLDAYAKHSDIQAALEALTPQQ